MFALDFYKWSSSSFLLQREDKEDNLQEEDEMFVLEGLLDDADFVRDIPSDYVRLQLKFVCSPHQGNSIASF